MELKITKDKVLDAASKCSTAKATLQILFPEAFAEDPIISNGRMFGKELFGNPLMGSDRAMIEIRASGSYKNKAFWLNEEFRWIIIEDTDGSQIIVPTKKH